LHERLIIGVIVCIIHPGEGNERPFHCAKDRHNNPAK
jgi:hypothetical protein